MSCYSIAAKKLGKKLRDIQDLTDVPKGCVFNPPSDFTNLYSNIGDYTKGNPNYDPYCKAVVDYWN